MIRSIPLLLAAWLALPGASAADVLIVADEFPAMEYVAAQLERQEGLTSKIVSQDQMPAALAGFRALIVYIHRELKPGPEHAMIDYTRNGGRLVALHHSISSGKRKNADWFPFLGIELPLGDVDQGGYKWIEPVTLHVVNLAPEHFITTHQVDYPERIASTPSEAPGGYRYRPGFTLPASEVYLNHRPTEPRTLLLGFKYSDAKTGRVWMQDRAGWLKPAGKGLIVYFLPGHSLLDFENAAYTRMIINAVIYQP
ncbi:MAG: hypothetical protein H7A45_11515 [Verrucomicrobiales bacterium]|nr:hypothetical protein [Verrucomicrobiales bacterium]MCP5526007.1 hypothetical protein [Verrucomicrobiales bacterium]